MKPERIQLSRRKGWRMPPKTVSVARPTKWGNPYVVAPQHYDGYVLDMTKGTIAVPSREAAVQAFRKWLTLTLEGQSVLREARAQLRGKNLACWCALHIHGEYAPCHADVLLELANADHAK